MNLIGKVRGRDSKTKTSIYIQSKISSNNKLACTHKFISYTLELLLMTIITGIKKGIRIDEPSQTRIFSGKFTSLLHVANIIFESEKSIQLCDRRRMSTSKGKTKARENKPRVLCDKKKRYGDYKDIQVL